MGKDVVTRVRQLAEEMGLDAVVAMSTANVTYVGGFEVPSQSLVPSRLVMCIVAAGSGSCQVVVNIEESLTRTESALDEVVAYNEFTEHPVDVFADTLRSMVPKKGRVGIELAHISAEAYERLRTRLGGAIELVDASELFTKARIVKTAAEIEAIRTVARLAHAAHYEALAETRPGDTELDIASRIISNLLGAGAEHVLRLVVGSGDRSWHANPAATSRVIEAGEMIRLDIFASKDTYLSDVARTAVVGTPTSEQADIWKGLLELRRTAFDMVKPGASTAAIYNRYRSGLEELGFSPINFLGHGLGLELHELPYVDRYSDTELEPGMVLSLEPYVMLPDRNWGFQVEDTVVVTEDGVDVLTDVHSDEELISVPLGAR
jgi:Xaa-Pro aminopeptidase